MAIKSNDKEIRYWFIYKITSPSGRVYIGKTCKLKNRFYAYKRHSCASQTILLNSLNKYGFDNHTFDIIEVFSGNNKLASEREIFWIFTYMTNFGKFPKNKGMNLTDGGEGVTGLIATESTRLKMIYNHKKRSPEEKKIINEKISATKKLRYTAKVKIKPTKEETRLKRSLAKKGKPTWNKGLKGAQVAWNKGKKIGTSWNKGITYSYLSEEEKKIKFGGHNIGNSYNKGRKQKSEFVEARIKRQIGKPLIKKYKPVLQYSLSGEFIKEHPSVKDTAINTGLSLIGVSKILRGEVKNPQSFIFKYKAA